MGGHSTKITQQPNYDRWKSVTVGMTYDEVVGLVGEPVRIAGMSRTVGKHYYLCFGALLIPSVPSKWFYRFTIGFGPEEKVWMKEDPFGGDLSDDGTPSIPKILMPADGARYTHYPRLLDLRWTPSSGQYPMKYTVELGMSDRSTPTTFRVWATTEHVPGTHLVIGIPGAGAYRVRCRGQNLRGLGDWCNYRHFEFQI